MQYSLTQIAKTLEHLCTLGSTDVAVEKINSACAILKEAIQELNGVPVAGKGALDCLLGCILTLEFITGAEEVVDDGR